MPLIATPDRIDRDEIAAHLQASVPVAASITTCIAFRYRFCVTWLLWLALNSSITSPVTLSECEPVILIASFPAISRWWSRPNFSIWSRAIFAVAVALDLLQLVADHDQVPVLPDPLQPVVLDTDIDVLLRRG